MPRPTLASVLVALLLAMLGLAAVSVLTRARSQRAVAATAQAAPPRHAAALKPVAELPGRPIAPDPSFTVAAIPAGERIALRDKPGGHVLARVGSTTEFGSRQTLAVAAARGRWIGVTSTDLPNGKIGWIDSQKARLATHKTHMSIRVDLSKRRLELRDGNKVVRRATVGIGRVGSATPTGRFAITDKMAGNRYGPYYGCCILALSGHQTNTPAGWQGGDRLAIHGTNAPGSIGVRSSAGCLHASAADLRVLMRRVPLGTPVFIRR